MNGFGFCGFGLVGLRQEVRQGNRGKNAHDGDDHQQLHQGEGIWRYGFRLSSVFGSSAGPVSSWLSSSWRAANWLYSHHKTRETQSQALLASLPWF